MATLWVGQISTHLRIRAATAGSRPSDRNESLEVYCRDVSYSGFLKTPIESLMHVIRVMHS
jgi:hypothetical protein